MCMFNIKFINLFNDKLNHKAIEGDGAGNRYERIEFLVCKR